jgi:outer membrane protein assembly factor BamB
VLSGIAESEFDLDTGFDDLQLYVLTHTGILTRFDLKTGIQTYKARIGEGGEFTSSPWAYNGKLFCMNEEGRTFVIRAGEKFEVAGSNDLGEMALATPAIIGDRLILRTEKHLYSIRNRAGTGSAK